MVEAGLLIAGDDIPVPYDRFRDRVMFPITDLRGRVIAFGGRALEKDVAGEIPEFAGNAAVSQGRQPLQPRAPRGTPPMTAAPLVVVEGYVDVIAMVGAGFPAQRGAARHRADRKPARAAVEDGGRADPVLRRRQGRAEAPRSAPSISRCRCSQPGKSLRFALLPEGQDPDDLARSGGRGAIEEVIAAARGRSPT